MKNIFHKDNFRKILYYYGFEMVVRFFIFARGTFEKCNCCNSGLHMACVRFKYFSKAGHRVHFLNRMRYLRKLSFLDYTLILSLLSHLANILSSTCLRWPKYVNRYNFIKLFLGPRWILGKYRYFTWLTMIWFGLFVS